MPFKRPKLRCSHLFTLIAVALLLPVAVKAQTGSVTMKAAVSEVVSLSVTPNFSHSDSEVAVVNSGNTVRITLSGEHATDPVIRVPLLLRSNSSFKLSAAAELQNAELTKLSIVDVRATGTLVAVQAVSELNIPSPFDARKPNGNNSALSNPLEVMQPVLVASGPRISLGGTLNSLDNALQITVLIRLKPEPARGWLVQLTFAATAESQAP